MHARTKRLTVRITVRILVRIIQIYLSRQLQGQRSNLAFHGRSAPPRLLQLQFEFIIIFREPWFMWHNCRSTSQLQTGMHEARHELVH
jgi:hypothetical protein